MLSLASADSAFPEDQKLLIEAAREFAQNELLPLDRQWDRDESSVASTVPRLAEMGLLNLTLPESLNGLGCSYRTYAAILHEIAAWSPSTCVTISVHHLTGNILHRFLNGPAQEAVLSQWGQADSFAAFALSEAEAGSDAGAAKTAAEEVDGGFRVNGEKMWITNGMTARWFLTLVRIDGTENRDGLCAVLIDGNDKGVERTKINGKMGIRGSETAVIHFTDVFVPEERIVGERGRGLNVMLSGLNEGRIGIAAQATGIAQACLTESVAYARERQQFNQPIGRLQAVGNMIAESATELEAAKALIWRAASKVDAGHADPACSAMAKLFASEAANRIAYRAVQIHGGAGYVNECRVEQLYRDVRVTSIYEGTSEIQRLVIARELAKR